MVKRGIRFFWPSEFLFCGACADAEAGVRRYGGGIPDQHDDVSPGGRYEYDFI